MTTASNDVVQPIHEQAVPVILMTAEQVDPWLNGSSVEYALAMRKPITDDALALRRQRAFSLRAV
jgi:putative SOS response-associated peptidase YedK